MADLMVPLTILSVFLLLGHILREIITPLQKLFIPASVIGGVLALVAGPQVLGLIPVPESFSQIPGELITIVMTALVFGISMDIGRAKAYGGYSLLTMIILGAQIAVGTAVGVALTAIWPLLPQGWGLMGPYAFFSGHGMAAAAGSVFEDQGVPENFGIGMILATIGLITAIVAGMVIVNWGVRRNLTAAQKNMQVQAQGGLIPAENRKSMGEVRVPSTSINGLAFQFCLLMLCFGIGMAVIELIGLVIPLISTMPDFVKGMIGAAILWPLLVKFKKRDYVDNNAISQISGFSLELIIFTAIATINLDLAGTFLAPILILSIILGVLTAAICLFLMRRLAPLEWFEKTLMAFGQGTGNFSTGLALVRTVDPELKSSAVDSAGVAAAITTPIVGLAPALLPLLVLGSEGLTVAVGLALALISLGIGRAFFWTKKTKNAKSLSHA